MGSVLKVVIVLQASYTIEEGQTYKNLNIHVFGLGKYPYWKAEVSWNASLRA